MSSFIFCRRKQAIKVQNEALYLYFWVNYQIIVALDQSIVDCVNRFFIIDLKKYIYVYR